MQMSKCWYWSPVPELSELLDSDPPIGCPDAELDAFDPAAAIGADTLLFCTDPCRDTPLAVELAASVALVRTGGVKDTWGKSNAGRDVGALNLAVAGDMRTENSKKVNICA